jgi:transcriptional regulator with XRE-family HTH domain
VTFGERFKQLREYLTEKYSIRDSQKAFGETIAVIGPTISNIELDKYIPSGDVINTLKKNYPELNLNWLFAEEGEMILTNEQESDANLLKKIIADKEHIIELYKKILQDKDIG